MQLKSPREKRIESILPNIGREPSICDTVESERDDLDNEELTDKSSPRKIKLC